MNIQRLYSLPNCKLLIEGLSNANDTSSTEVRPLLSMLVNVECHLAATDRPLTGGRDFFESLVAAVSAYAQEFLSKVHHPLAHKHRSGLVELHKVDDNWHRLIVHSKSETQGSNVGESPNQPPIQINLTTVQLFDLVEAVDQFFADSQTLPDLSPQLLPISKRFVTSSQIVAKQALPTAVGVSSLALAAIAFFFIPIPTKLPQPHPQSNSTRSSTNPSTRTNPIPKPIKSP
ncbi:MAG: DUF4335 domain-containing protein [Chroococcidiopsidaceae cyanobacterium CP_BM_RX_35]|nr:DUF4335 domain-containing protein [Chroococcidiopsidaceae cyanobacterium CP_BM_RX_35]